MSFRIESATVHDLDDLAPLYDAYRQFYDQAPDPVRARDFLAERIERSESLILLARDAQGAALGFTQLYPLFSSVRAVRTYLLNDLFVAISARRQGVAKALMQAAAAAATARGASSLSLSTALDNLPAQTLYESLGWQRDQHFCHYGLRL
ncbi:GNAT family N-acetyltransferase [Dyella sp. A6]|uniref:GNAT family N-acetyltransferase n=1 Tax=Dyella aluminiiresistens TaxID=3069105 RepID=UPI002E75ACF0|nr:GNAT family N-acetyltransferase [Dyella sp. A6]